MSQDRYFNNFPVINYNNTAAVDITKRIVFLNNILKNPYLFYPYEINSYERAEQFGYRYYDDQYKDWVVYLGNQIVDPYYEWYLDYDTFKQFIQKKYGTVELAQTKIKHFECNWENADEITVSRYESLELNLKKYWEPDYQNSKRIIAYKRKQISEIKNTNSVKAYVVEKTGFKHDEICDIVFNNNTIGSGQVMNQSDNNLYIRHVTGTTVSTIDVGVSYILGKESKIKSNFTQCKTIIDIIDPIEASYWMPISYYQYEEDKNAYNKTIKVLDKKYAKQIADNLTDVLK